MKITKSKLRILIKEALDDLEKKTQEELRKAGIEIPTGCLTGSCGACEIDVNGETIRACISDIKSKKNCLLKVSLTTDPFW